MPNSLILKWTGRFGSEAESAVAELSRYQRRERFFESGQEISPAPADGQQTLLSEGFAARYRLLDNGRRQITAIHVPGDFIDLAWAGEPPSPQGVTSLSPLNTVTYTHEGIRGLTESAPLLARCLWSDTRIEAEIAREWLVAMGRRTARGHMAHFLCELFVRLSVVRRTRGREFRLPLTQNDMADALGLSIVHVNRVLKTLRSDGLVTLSDQNVAIHDWQRLVHVAEFEPAYLGFLSVAAERQARDH